MALAKINKVRGRAVHVSGDDVDTDRIIPARFMKCVTFDGLGEYMFYDVRKDAEGNDRKHPLNDPRFAGAEILLAGNNFGCGSSREHAPQAIYRAGFRAVIAEGFAEIFFGNSIQLGMPCVVASGDDIARLAAVIEAEPNTEVTIDLENLKVRYGQHAFDCIIREGARSVLLNGHWDPLQDLISAEEQVEAVAASLPYMAAPSR
jgi:3-isopropylmalate/(R)-2-methylmalate dehydratase small subunit